jgi:hypothetical protein
MGKVLRPGPVRRKGPNWEKALTCNYKWVGMQGRGEGQ